MNAEKQTATAETSEDSDADTNTEFTPRDANNFIRGNAGACLLISEEIQGDTVETAFITVNRTYFRIKEFGRPSKVKRHTMSEALRTARQNGHDVELAAYQQTDLDIESAIEFIRDTFELEDKDSKASYGLSRDHLDEAGDDHLEVASAPAGTSDQHGGGW